MSTHDPFLSSLISASSVPEAILEMRDVHDAAAKYFFLDHLPELEG